MPAFLQFCVVVVTIAVVVIAIAAVRLMARLDRSADDASKTFAMVRTSLERVQDMTREMHEVLDSMRSIAPPIRRVALQFEALGQRTAELSDAVLQEVEAPVRTALSVARGVRAGTSFFLDRFTQRLAHRRAATNGGHDHA